jgi:hypothetical protein
MEVHVKVTLEISKKALKKVSEGKTPAEVKAFLEANAEDVILCYLTQDECELFDDQDDEDDE